MHQNMDEFIVYTDAIFVIYSSNIGLLIFFKTINFQQQGFFKINIQYF